MAVSPLCRFKAERIVRKKYGKPSGNLRDLLGRQTSMFPLLWDVAGPRFTALRRQRPEVRILLGAPFPCKTGHLAPSTCCGRDYGPLQGSPRAADMHLIRFDGHLV